MPSSSVNSSLPSSQPAARQKPKPPDRVLAEAEAQWLFSESDLARTPSIVDGMTPEKEKEMRGKGVNFIMQVGIMLKLPQLTLSTASVFFNRFLMRTSVIDKPGMKALHHYQIGATSLFLATKVEENCRRMKEIIIACCRVAQKNPNIVIDEQSKDYWRWRDTILYNEDILLEMLCFDLTIEAPHKILFDFLKYYSVEHNKKLRNAAWAFVNDSNLTQLCLLFNSRTIAAAALYCAAKHCGVAFADDDAHRPWWTAQCVALPDMRRACNYMARCYEHTPVRAGGDSIYVGLHTPEDGDPALAKTRLRRSRTPPSPTPADAKAERALSAAGSEKGGVKREREDGRNGDDNGSERRRESGDNRGHAAPARFDGEDPGQDHPGTEEREAKRAKLEAGAEPNGQDVKAEEIAPSQPPEESAPPKRGDDLSEEGELEE
ncbi:hypothetical protein LTR39_003618 [Cryomyces antarcticus]|nr:hypothetical protein LTR39_003618 [Cryomyces antarcticus]